MQKGCGLKLPVSVTKKDGLFIATCNVLNITVKAKTEAEMKMNFVYAVDKVIHKVFEHMVLNQVSQEKRKEEESFCMGV